MIEIKVNSSQSNQPVESRQALAKVYKLLLHFGEEEKAENIVPVNDDNSANELEQSIVPPQEEFGD